MYWIRKDCNSSLKFEGDREHQQLKIYFKMTVIIQNNYTGILRNVSPKLTNLSIINSSFLKGYQRVMAEIHLEYYAQTAGQNENCS